MATMKVTKWVKRQTARRKIHRSFRGDTRQEPEVVGITRLDEGWIRHVDATGTRRTYSPHQMRSARAEVNRGARLLDRRCPGWEEQIALDMLDIGSCEVCVCGQLALAASSTTPAGKAIRAAMREGDTPFAAFESTILTGRRGYSHGFAGGGELEVAWHELVTRRLAKKAKAAA